MQILAQCEASGHLGMELLALLNIRFPSVTFGVVTAQISTPSLGANLSVYFCGPRARDGSLLAGSVLVSDVVLLFLHDGHYQILSVRGDLIVHGVQKLFSAQQGHGEDVVVLDCSVLLSRGWLAGASSSMPHLHCLTMLLYLLLRTDLYRYEYAGKLCITVLLWYGYVCRLQFTNTLRSSVIALCPFSSYV